MAAITNNLESAQEEGFEEAEPEVAGEGSFAGFAGPAANTRSIGSAHAQLSKTVWLRALLGEALKTRSYELHRSAKGEYSFIVTPGFGQYEVPWSPFPEDDYRIFKLFSLENAKMAAPSFSLPAGGMQTGATCPGADAGQTTSTFNARKADLRAVDGAWALKALAPGSGETVPVKEGLTICSRCYATGGNFAYANIQMAELIRYWWLRQMLAAGKMDDVVRIFLDAVLHLPVNECAERFYINTQYGERQVRPIRLHDSGDFFSIEYAEMWCRVADALADEAPEFVIWAPTRTWASSAPHKVDGFESKLTWSQWWYARLGALRSLQTIDRPNLIVRPSGYNFGDAAPGPLHPRNSKGSTSLFKPSANVPEELRSKVDAMTVAAPGAAEPRVDWNCQVYGAETPSCLASAAPDGKQGCRVCWVRPDLSVNYTAH